MNADSNQNANGPAGPAMAAAIRSCVHCGFCLAACPTYRELGEEMDSPRGRIVLMSRVLDGELSAEEAGPYIDRCLGCLACEPACPSGVAYRDLISPFRAMTEASRSRPVMERFRLALVSQTLPYPGRFRLAATLGGVGGKWLAALAPDAIRPMIDLLPARLPPRQTWPAVSPARGSRRARVALLTGCAQQVLDPETNTATIDVLTRNGVEVIVPESQGCCGALSWHIGDAAAARKFARNNLTAFPDDIDAIITNAAGCGSAMHEYPLMFAGTNMEEEAAAFRSRVCDVTVFLQNLGGLREIPDPGRPLRIAYHDACHLANAQGVRSEPRELLRLIPGAEILEIADPHLCCGSAGTYNIDQPEIAAPLGAAKARNMLATHPDLIATGNIGCLTQIQLHLVKQGASIPIRHTIGIIADAYAGRLGARQ